jgi:type II secretory pathway pseudopilin PulG
VEPVRSERGGWTLIEIVVVMALLIVLATLALAISPRLLEQAKAARGAGQLQGWLLVARQLALRDRTPTGLRMQVDADGYVRQLAYIQQPDDFSGGGPCRGSSGQNPLLFDPPTDFTGGQPGSPDQFSVQPGDYLELNGGGPVHQIQGVRGGTALDLVIPATLPGTPTWRILRQPRLLVGEQTLPLPLDVAIDLNPGRSQGVPVRSVPPPPGSKQPPTAFWEILFAPSGAVIGKGTVGAKIFLWVRDVTFEDPDEGEPTILAVQVRTGFISAHPVNRSGDPYLFASDDRSSGM